MTVPSNPRIGRVCLYCSEPIFFNRVLENWGHEAPEMAVLFCPTRRSPGQPYTEVTPAPFRLAGTLTLKDWTAELAVALATGPGAWSTLTLATYRTAAAGVEVIEAARTVAAEAGFTVYEFDARKVAADPGILPTEAGYVILHHLTLQPMEAVLVLLETIQELRLIQQRPVGALLIGSPAGIKALRRQARMGSASAAEMLDV